MRFRKRNIYNGLRPYYNPYNTYLTIQKDNWEIGRKIMPMLKIN